MKKSYRILQLQFQLQFYKGTHPPYTIHPHTTYIHASRKFSIQNPILHAEDKELFEYCYYYYIQRAKRPSFQKRNSTHRRQGDLLEIHLCVLQDIPVFPDIPDIPVFSDIPDIPVFPDIPVIQDTPEIFRTFQSFMTFQPSRQFYKFQYLQGIHPIPAFSD